jgi:hypothetical protein
MKILTALILRSSIKHSWIIAVGIALLLNAPAVSMVSAQERIITVEFRSVNIVDNLSFTDAEKHLFGTIFVDNGCIINPFNNQCEPSAVKSVYLSPGSGLWDSGDQEYYFVVPERFITLRLFPGGSFSVGSWGWNQDGPNIGTVDRFCYTRNNLCDANPGGNTVSVAAEGYEPADYYLRFVVYG